MSELNTSPAVLIATAGAAALALSACGGGAGTPSTGSGSGGGTTPPVVLPPTTPKPTAVQSSRLLAQSLFGATDTDLTAVQTQGYSAWLDAQFALPASQTGWDWLMANGYNDATFITHT